jgi:hypothetical protein
MDLLSRLTIVPRPCRAQAHTMSDQRLSGVRDEATMPPMVPDRMIGNIGSIQAGVMFGTSRWCLVNIKMCM